MLEKFFKVVFVFCGMLFGYGISNYTINESPLSRTLDLDTSSMVLFIALFTALFAIIFLYIFNSSKEKVKGFIKKTESLLVSIPPVELAAGVVGFVAGIFIAYLISQIINGIPALQTAYINVIISVLLYVGLGAAGLFFFRNVSARLRGNNLAGIITERREGKSKSRQNGGAVPKILDTSVIIDGRIADILRTGFIEGDIVIPEFVLVELRHIADSSDSLKRNRGRRGLDVLNLIQSEYGVDIYNTAKDKGLEEIPEVDVKLLKLAQKMNGMVVTNDYNLNKVASIQGVGVLNINELANTLKPVVLPGEEMQVFLVKDGKENGQAVAYLDDGTMIVVEAGKEYIGRTINVTVTSVLQTSAGRMIFARPKVLKK